MRSPFPIDIELVAVADAVVSWRIQPNHSSRATSASSNVRGSYSARVLRSSSAKVHREFVHHIVEDEVDGQEEGQDDKREDGQQREESGVVEENQTHNMSAWR